MRRRGKRRGHSSIKQAQRENERRLLNLIETVNREGHRFWPTTLSPAWWNALDRLQTKGLVRYSRSRTRRWSIGYVAVGVGVGGVTEKRRRRRHSA